MSPIRPQGVRIDHLDGSSTPCELTYVGQDDRGIHLWGIATEVRPGDRLHVKVMPPRTGLTMGAAEPGLSMVAGEPPWTPDDAA